MKKFFLPLVLIAFLLFGPFSFVSTAQAAFNPEINYQGKLEDSGGSAVADGSYNIQFKLYTVATSGSAIWTETHCFSPDSGVTCDGTGTDSRISLVDGLFSVMLGDITSLADINFDQPLWLGVNVGGSGSTPSYDGEMSPRKELGAVPAAFVADTLDGIESGQFLRNDSTNSTSSATTSFAIYQNGSGNAAQIFGNGGIGLTVTSDGSVSISGTSTLATTTINGDFTVNGDFSPTNIDTGSATFTAATTTNLSVSGDASLTEITFANGTSTGSLNIGDKLGLNSEYFTDLTGTGLTNTSGALTVDQSTLSVESFTTSLTEGSVVFSKGSNLAEDNANFFWDDTNNRLGIGTTSPSYDLHVDGDINLGSTTDAFRVGGVKILSFGSTISPTGDFVDLYAGDKVGVSTETGGENIGYGFVTLNSLTTGTSNVGVGAGVCSDCTTGSRNVGFGRHALRFNTVGSDNVAIGEFALEGGIATPADLGDYNTAVGSNALVYNRSDYITAIGHKALWLHATGTFNTAVGTFAGKNVTVGDGNTFLGYIAGQNTTTADNNTVLGYGALSLNVLGGDNTVIGTGAFLQATTSSDNVGVGHNVGFNMTSGNNNTFIGTNAGYTDGTTATTDGISNATAIGYNAQVQASNSLILGGTGASSVNVGIGTTSPYAKLSVAGHIVGAYLTATSSTASSTLPQLTTTDLNISEDLSLAGQYGTSGQILTSQGTGTAPIWTTVSGGGGTPAGSDRQVQFNDSGSFGADANLVFTSSGNLGIGTTSPYAKLSVVGETVASHFTATTTATSTLPELATTNLTATGYLELADSTATTTGVIFQNGVSLLHTYGIQNTFLGEEAGNHYMSGVRNVAVGQQAFTSNTTGNFNIAMGRLALRDNTTGSDNTAIGYVTLENNTTGTHNTAIGSTALDANTTGGSNTAVGSLSLSGNTTGGSNTAVGVNAMNANTTGSNNTALGVNALPLNTTGYNNTAIGHSAMLSNSTGHSNTAVGHNSLNANTTGTYNSALGHNALDANTTGTHNSAFGYQSITANTTGIQNTAYGYNTLAANTTGSNNTAIGNNALVTATSSSNNIAFGAGTLQLTTGANNIGIGFAAGQDLTTGSNNILIGYDIEAASNTASNQLNIGNLIFSEGIDGTGTTLSSGNIGIGTSSPYAKLSVEGEIVSTYLTATSSTASSTLPQLTTTDLNISSDLSLAGQYGTSGQVLTSQGTTSAPIWSTISSGSSDFIGLTDTQGSLNANRIIFTNAAGTALSDNADLVFDGTNFGIGTSTPAVKLDVEGKVSVGYGAASNDYESFLIRHDSNSGGGYFVQKDGGDKFVALAGFDGGSSKGLYYGGGGWGAHDANQHRFYTDPNTPTTGNNGGLLRMIITKDGNVGIGTTTSPQRMLHVTRASDGPPVRFEDSNGYCEIDPTVTTWSCTSDERLKENIEPLSSSHELERLKQLNPVEFEWKKDKTNGKRYGLIAQEVEKIIPEIVKTDTETGIKTVAYGGLVPYILAAIQELAKQIDELKTVIGDTVVTGYTAAVGAFKQVIVGSERDPGGIQMYDEENGDPYCLTIRGGSVITRSGTCDIDPDDVIFEKTIHVLEDDLSTDTQDEGAKEEENEEEEEAVTSEGGDEEEVSDEGVDNAEVTEKSDDTNNTEEATGDADGEVIEETEEAEETAEEENEEVTEVVEETDEEEVVEEMANEETEEETAEETEEATE